MPKTVAKIEDLEGIPGKLWVQASYKKDEDEEIVLVDEVAMLPVRVFPEGVVPATVWASVGRKVQVQRFEPMEINMGCSLPCLPEERQEALVDAYETANSEFKSAMRKALMSLKEKGLR